MGHFLGHFCLYKLPLLQQRAAQNRLDDALYGGGVGVVGAQLAAFGRVQAAFKQGAKNAHVNGAPVQPRGVAQFGNVQNLELGHVDLVEQAAVEPGEFVRPVQAAAVHGGKQGVQALGEFVAVQMAVAHQAVKHAAGQQAHVFGKKAEQALG